MKKLASKNDDTMPPTLDAAVPASSPEESSCIEVEPPTSIDQSLYAQLTKCTAVPESTINSILRRAEELITFLATQMNLMKIILQKRTG